MYPPKKGMGLDGTCFTKFNFTIVSETYFGISVMNPSGRFFSPGHNVCLPVTHAHVFARMPYAVRRMHCGIVYKQ